LHDAHTRNVRGARSDPALAAHLRMLGYMWSCSGLLQEFQIEGRKHQYNTDVRRQPFPESIPEELYIYSNDDGYQHRRIKHNKHVS